MRGKEKGKEEQLALANTLSRIVLTSPDIMDMGRRFVFELKQLMPVNWTTIGLIDESTSLFHIFTLSPKLGPGQESDKSILLDETPATWLVRNKKALLEPDLLIESRFRTGDYWLDKGLRTIVYMPLFAGGAVFGSLIFASTRPRAYGDRELKLLKYATSQLAAPIRYSKLFSHIFEGQQVTPISDGWMTRTEQTLQELTEAVSEYALHLKSHTAAIQGLSEASQELKSSAAEQNRVLADLVDAIKQAPSQIERTATVEQGPASPADESTHPPGCYHRQHQPVQPETLVEKQRKILGKKSSGKRSVRGKKSINKDNASLPSSLSRYRRRLSPPL